MRKKSLSRFKIQRRLLTELPGLGKAGALERKPYPPGQHGSQRIKYSDYRLQLEEKQKIKYHYDLRDEQLLRIVKKSKKKSKHWVAELAKQLELRLQNIIFRSGFARSQYSAAQMVSHGHVLLNGKKVNVRSQILKEGDVITLNEKGIKNQIYLQAKDSPRLVLPDWLLKEDSSSKPQIKIIANPSIESIPFAFDESLVTSFYSKV